MYFLNLQRSVTAFGQILCLIFEEQDSESYQSILDQTKILIANSLKNTPIDPLNFDVLSEYQVCSMHYDIVLCIMIVLSIL